MFTVFRRRRDGLATVPSRRLLSGRNDAISVGTLSSVSRLGRQPLRALQARDWPHHSDVTNLFKRPDGTISVQSAAAQAAAFPTQEDRQLRAQQEHANEKPGLRRIVDPAEQSADDRRASRKVVRFDGRTFSPYSIEVIDGFGTAITVDRDGVNLYRHDKRPSGPSNATAGYSPLTTPQTASRPYPSGRHSTDRDRTLLNSGTSNSLAKHQDDRFVRQTSPNLFRPGAATSSIFSRDHDGGLVGRHQQRPAPLPQAAGSRSTERLKVFPAIQADGIFEDPQGSYLMSFRDAICSPSAAARAAGSLAQTACRATRSAGSPKRATAPCSSARSSISSRASTRAPHNDPRTAPTVSEQRTVRDVTEDGQGRMSLPPEQRRDPRQGAGCGSLR